MRSTIIVVCATLAYSASSVSAGCSQKSNQDIITTVGCGITATFSECVSKFSSISLYAGDLRQCLQMAECEPQQIDDALHWMENGCDLETSRTKEWSRIWRNKPAVVDLRKRQTTAAPAAAATTLATVASTTAAGSAETSGSTASITNSNLVCLATGMVPVTWCSTVTNAGVESSSCQTTSTATSSCAPGLICQTSTAEVVICMKRDNNLTTSGLVVTISFGVVIAILIGSMLFMCISASKASALAKSKRENVFMLDSKKAGESRSEADLPLMAQPGQAGGNYDYGGRYDDGGVPPVPAVPKLHPGLVSIPGGSYHGEEDLNYQSGAMR